MKIAVAGKGGVGKSSISSCLIQFLSRKNKNILAIDADSSPHLARLLGFKEMDAIIPICEMRDMLCERSEKDGPFYRMNPRVTDIPEKFLLKKGNINLMVIGAIQVAGEGCACAENTVLKALLTALFLSPNEIVIVDLEAGVEHLGRGTISVVDHLLIVVQPYRGSIETAKKIYKLSEQLGIKQIHFIGNRIKDANDIAFLENYLGHPLLEWLPDNPCLTESERKCMTLCDTDITLSGHLSGLCERLGIAF
jgi:CO dehydrogenase maturation factor